MEKLIEIAAGEMAVGQNEVIIRTCGVGSCIVICLYDKMNRIGGLAHCMLPSSISRKDSKLRDDKGFVAKYVDRGVERLLGEMLKSGAVKENIKARIVGGSEMIKLFKNNTTGLGVKNTDAARTALRNYGVPIESEDVGGNVGRNVDFNLTNGILSISVKL